MTTIEMQTRVMVQLRSLPPGQARTAAEIAAGMVGVTPAQVEATLKIMERANPQQLAAREQDGKRPDRWRLA